MNNYPAAILTLEQNPPKRMFHIYIYKKSFQEDFALDQNCGRLILRCTTLFLLATCVLPAYPNFGQAKHGQKGSAATFRPKRVPSVYRPFHLLLPITIFLFVFEPEAEE